MKGTGQNLYQNFVVFTEYQNSRINVICFFFRIQHSFLFCQSENYFKYIDKYNQLYTKFSDCTDFIQIFFSQLSYMKGKAITQTQTKTYFAQVNCSGRHRNTGMLIWQVDFIVQQQPSCERKWPSLGNLLQVKQTSSRMAVVFIGRKLKCVIFQKILQIEKK